MTSQSGSNKLNVSKNSEESVDSVSIYFKKNMSNMNMSNDKKVCQFCETASCTASCKTSCESKTLSPDFKNQKKIHVSDHTNLHFNTTTISINTNEESGGPASTLTRSSAESKVIEGNLGYGENKNKEEGVSVYKLHGSKSNGVSVSTLINFYNSLFSTTM